MMMKEEEIKEHLMSSNPEFRRLVEEHKLYEASSMNCRVAII